jgi:hypothetical protein
MPLYNSDENNILSSLEKTYRALRRDEVSKDNLESHVKEDNIDLDDSDKK